MQCKSVTATGTACDEQHDLLLGISELQVDRTAPGVPTETLAKPDTNRLGIAYRQQFGRQHHGDAAIRLQEG